MALTDESRKRGGFARAREHYPPRTASITLQQIFQLMSASGVSLRAVADDMKINETNLSRYRSGKTEPGIMKVEEMAQHLGYRLQLVPINRDQEG